MRPGYTPVTRILGAALCAALCVGAPASAHARPHGFVPGDATSGGAVAPRSRTSRASLSLGLRAPLRGLEGLFGVLRPAPGQVVSRERGRQVLDFPVREEAIGVFLDVRGRVAFERAVIGFADGEVREVDAWGLERANGLFELTRFDRARPLAPGHVVLLARSRRARVGVRLGI